MNEAYRLIERADHYDLPFAGWHVTQCFVDFAFGFRLSGETHEATVRIEGEFAIEGTNAKMVLSPERSDALAPALALLHQVVETARAYKNGTLKVQFRGGTCLVVQADAQYEAWEVSGSQGFRLVCLPDRNIAIWQPTPEI